MAPPRTSRIRPDLLRRDRGSLSIWMATASLVMVVLVGLAVDLGGQVYAQQRATDLAAEAARTGGQQVLAGPAIRGTSVQVDTGAAVAAARSYLAAAGLPGTVSVHAGTSLEVTTRDTYQTRFLSIIGINTLPITGHATASLIKTLNGTEQ